MGLSLGCPQSPDDINILIFMPVKNVRGHPGALSVHHYHDFICWKPRCNWALCLWFGAFRTASTLCAAPDLIFLIRLWTLSSGETAQAPRRTVESNTRNETTTSRESRINGASTMNPDSKVELYVLIKPLYWKCTGGVGTMQSNIYECNPTWFVLVSRDLSSHENPRRNV